MSRLTCATMEGNDENNSLLFLLDESCETLKGQIFRILSLFETLSVLGRERWRMVEGRRTKRAEALRKTLRGSFLSGCRKWFVFRHLIGENGGARTLGGGDEWQAVRCQAGG